MPENENALLSLQQIGYKDQNSLLEELSSQHPNMTKVFFLMLTKSFDPSNLPWDNIQESNQDDLIFVHPFVFPMDFEAPAYDPFTEPASPTYDSKPSSWVSHSSWLPQPYQAIYEQERTIHRINLRLPEMMLLLQGFLNEKDYQWFYPNAQTLISRDSSEKFYITLIAVYITPQIISLDVKMSHGTEMAFDLLFNSLTSIFTNYIIIDDIPLNESYTLLKTESNALDTGNEGSCNPE